MTRFILTQVTEKRICIVQRAKVNTSVSIYHRDDYITNEITALRIHIAVADRVYPQLPVRFYPGVVLHISTGKISSTGTIRNIEYFRTAN